MTRLKRKREKKKKKKAIGWTLAFHATICTVPQGPSSKLWALWKKLHRSCLLPEQGLPNREAGGYIGPLHAAACGIFENYVYTKLTSNSPLSWLLLVLLMTTGQHEPAAAVSEQIRFNKRMWRNVGPSKSDFRDLERYCTREVQVRHAECVSYSWAISGSQTMRGKLISLNRKKVSHYIFMHLPDHFINNFRKAIFKKIVQSICLSVGYSRTSRNLFPNWIMNYITVRNGLIALTYTVKGFQVSKW